MSSFLIAALALAALALGTLWVEAQELLETVQQPEPNACPQCGWTGCDGSREICEWRWRQ